MGDGKYPLHDKLKSVRAEHRTVEDFLDWLQTNGMWICELDEYDRFYPTSSSNAQIIADYFEIDLKKFDAEKAAMLEVYLRYDDTQAESSNG